MARAQLERLLQAWHGPASASQGSPPALVPSSWGVRTPLAGRPAQDPVHSPVGEGNVCGPGARRASQAALVWVAELAARAARTARATAATKAATPAVAAEVQDALEAATTACPSADRRTALGVHASGRRAGRVSLRSRRTRPAGRRQRATPSLVTSSLPWLFQASHKRQIKPSQVKSSQAIKSRLFDLRLLWGIVEDENRTWTYHASPARIRRPVGRGPVGVA